MKTSELTGAALDWAVAKCGGIEWGQGDLDAGEYGPGYAPSTDWSQGGPIIEREQIEVRVHEGGRVKCKWKSGHWDEDKGVCVWSVGSTPLIAAMRRYTASILGDEVEIPPELTK